MKYIGRYHYLVFGIILGLGVMLRAVEIINGNYVFQFDQGLYYEDVRLMIQKGMLRLTGTYTPIPGMFQGPYFYYFLAIFYLLFRGDPYGGMVLVFAIGVLSAIAAYIVARKLYSNKTALVVLFLTSLSPALIASSRLLWPPYIIYLIMPFYLYAMVQIARRRLYFIPIAFFLVSLIFSFEIPSGGLLVLPTIVSILYFNRTVIGKPKYIAFSIVAFLLPLVPLIVFDLRHDHITYNGLVGVLRGDYSAGTGYSTYADSIAGNFISLRSNFSTTFLYVGSIWEYILFFVTLCYLFYFWKYKHFTNDERLSIVNFLILLAITYAQVLVLKTVVWGWYLIHVSMIYIFLFGIVVSKGLKKNMLGISALVVVAVLSYFSIDRVIYSYRIELYDNGGFAKIAGKKEGLDFIYNDAKGEPFNVLIFSPPIYTYPYDYLFEWYGREKYGYVPGREKKDTFYLLIEPDPNKPWSYNGWKETVIIEGQVLWEETLPSGLIIEKRIKQ